LKYEPKPIDTSKVKLAPYLEEIIEKLSISVHDNWAQKRISEGWKYGPKRDDILREHPCLVPYAELPEEEKDYDRKTLTESIKMLIASGCIINTPSSGGAAYAELLTVDSFRQLGENLRRRGDSLQAYDAIETGLSSWPQDTRLLQLKALVLADLGVLKGAREILIQLVEEGHADEETLGILARTYKEEWLQSRDPKNVKKYLSLAFETYQRCFTNSGGYYPGINTATLATLLGKSKTAKKIASIVCKDCLQKLADPEERSNAEYYLTATLAEAYLILNEYDKAHEYYALTGKLGKGMPQDLQATRKNARFLIKYLGIDGSSIENALQLPGVAVFTSDTIIEDNDGKGSNVPHNPKHIEYIVNQFCDILDRRKIGIGYSSAKAGHDLCFLNALREKGCEAYITLPFNKDKFLLECIGVAGGREWERLFEDIFNALHNEERVSFASEWPIGKMSDAFFYTNQYLFGLALLKARQLDTSLYLVSATSADAQREHGPTYETVRWWESIGYIVEKINIPLNMVKKSKGTAKKKSVNTGGENDRDFQTNIMAIFFADVVGYSKMHEGYVPAFVKEFMGDIADFISASKYKPETRNTWGDALYFVFKSIRDAGVFALEVADIVARTPWEKRGLPKGLNLRISLHAGPVYHCKDPVTGQEMYTGSHVSRAARIEPVTPPGQIYCSQAFAALAAAYQVEEFYPEYVGKVNYAKGFGKFSTYRVRRNYDFVGKKQNPC